VTKKTRVVQELDASAVELVEATEGSQPGQRQIETLRREFQLKFGAPRQEMPETDFKSTVSKHEVAVTHTSQGHVYRFPILANGTVSLHGSRIESNPDANREAGSFCLRGSRSSAHPGIEQAKLSGRSRVVAGAVLLTDSATTQT
jgi:hypothetical protein